MDNHKTKLVTYADDAIITNLSDHLIDLILERLPIKDAVRTSILSRKWRYRWTTMRTLVLHDISKIGAYHRNGFIRIINQIMIHHKGPILKFYLDIPNIFLDSFQEIDQWMLILSRNSVRELTIMNLNWIYPIPSSVFCCLELRALGLCECIFKPPLEFQGFPNLEDMFLTRIDFGDNLGGNVINLPQLKKLTLHTCVNVNNFKIKAVKLHKLWVVRCPDAMLLQLMHSQCLNAVRVCIKIPIEPFLQVQRFDLPMMLSYLPNVVSFMFDGYFFKFLAAEKQVPKWLPHEIKCLKQLEFQTFSFDDLDQVQGALYMLRNSVNLEVFRVTHMEMGPEADLELTSSYLELPDCLNQTLLMLQTVEMTCVEGSKPELLFIKLLLDHSPHLENMIIRPSAMADAQKMLNIAKDVMMFPRASAKAKMVYLDPEP